MKKYFGIIGLAFLFCSSHYALATTTCHEKDPCEHNEFTEHDIGYNHYCSIDERYRLEPRPIEFDGVRHNLELPTNVQTFRSYFDKEIIDTAPNYFMPDGETEIDETKAKEAFNLLLSLTDKDQRIITDCTNLWPNEKFGYLNHSELIETFVKNYEMISSFYNCNPETVSTDKTKFFTLENYINTMKANEFEWRKAYDKLDSSNLLAEYIVLIKGKQCKIDGCDDDVNLYGHGEEDHYNMIDLLTNSPKVFELKGKFDDKATSEVLDLISKTESNIATEKKAEIFNRFLTLSEADQIAWTENGTDDDEKMTNWLKNYDKYVVYSNAIKQHGYDLLMNCTQITMTSELLGISFFIKNDLYSFFMNDCKGANDTEKYKNFFDKYSDNFKNNYLGNYVSEADSSIQNILNNVRRVNNNNLSLNKKTEEKTINLFDSNEKQSNDINQISKNYLIAENKKLDEQRKSYIEIFSKDRPKLSTEENEQKYKK